MNSISRRIECGCEFIRAQIKNIIMYIDKLQNNLSIKKRLFDWFFIITP